MKSIARKRVPAEFLIQALALIISVIIVHGIYVSVVRPNAEVILLEQSIRINEDVNYVPERSAFVLIRDFEQESCFILMLWVFALMGHKALQTARERRLLSEELVPISDGTSVLPEDTREYARPVQALPEETQQRLLPRTFLTALHRFRSTRNIQIGRPRYAICVKRSPTVWIPNFL